MKKYLLILSIISTLGISCSDESFETTNMRINHFQQTAIGLDQRLVYLIQEGNEIGTNDWTYFYNNIEGFDYELGYVYDISVIKETISNPPTDRSSIKYTLNKIISKERVTNNITFEIRLKSVIMSNPPSFVTGNINSGFKILDTIEIDCNDLCDEMNQMLVTENELLGVFNHTDAGSIKLTALKPE